jgi:hypothetical protein
LLKKLGFVSGHRFSDAASASTSIIPLAGCGKSRVSYQGMPSGIPQVAQNQALAHGFILFPQAVRGWISNFESFSNLS